MLPVKRPNLSFKYAVSFLVIDCIRFVIDRFSHAHAGHNTQYSLFENNPSSDSRLLFASVILISQTWEKCILIFYQLTRILTILNK